MSRLFKRPPSNAAVMVYIFGGGFTAGNGYQGYYGGTALAAIGDVIVVTLNYRVSTFGYLTTGDEECPGNYGMLDQVEALRWVNTNIGSFGGNAKNITIFGESAGASSVSTHLFSPLSEPLFQQAILQSGSSVDDWSHHEDLDKQRDIAFQLGELVGCSASTTRELMSCLRQVDAEELNQASYEFGYYAGHCVDNNFLVEHPRDSARNNNFKKCPLINGFNKDEATIYIFWYYFYYTHRNTSDAPYVSKQLFDSEIPKLITEYDVYSNALIEDGLKLLYVDWSRADDPEYDYFEVLNNVLTDYWYSCPALFETSLHASAGVHDVYMYHFAHSPSIPFYITPTWTRASHGEELQFVFGYPFDTPHYLEFHQYTDEELEFSFKVMKYWTNFAKTGNPNKESPSAPPYDDDRGWHPFTIPEMQYKELALNLTTGSGLRANHCRFWNDYLGKLRTFTVDLEMTQRQWREDFYDWKYGDLEEWKDAFEEYKNNADNRKRDEL